MFSAGFQTRWYIKLSLGEGKKVGTNAVLLPLTHMVCVPLLWIRQYEPLITDPILPGFPVRLVVFSLTR